MRKFIEDVAAIHFQFEEVKGVLRWLNRNATPGAIRFYFPSVLKLCPTSLAFADLQHVPARYSNPQHIGSWIEPIKTAAATVAGSALLPTGVEPRPRSKMRLTFPMTTVNPDVNAAYRTDQIIYHI